MPSQTHLYHKKEWILGFRLHAILPAIHQYKAACSITTRALSCQYKAACSASTRSFVLRHALSSRPLNFVGVHKKHNEVALTFNAPVN